MNPLIALSRLLFLLVRFLLRRLVGLKMRREQGQGAQPEWVGYGELLHQYPLFFHYSQFNAPRWNCHAALGILRGLEIKNRLSLRLGQARDGAEAWSLVLYGNGSDNRTESAIGPEQPIDPEGYSHFEVAGNFNLGARYYGCRPDAHWPEVLVDGKIIPAKPLGTEPDRYRRKLEGLAERGSWFYRLVHYHLFAALRRYGASIACDGKGVVLGDSKAAQSAKHLERLVRWALPVGNPHTAYRFGFFPKGARLRIRLSKGLLAENLCFFSQLDRSSLPVFFTQLESTDWTSPANPVEGLYLLRIQARPGCKPQLEEAQLEWFSGVQP